MDDEEVACPQCGHRVQEDTVYRADYDPQELLDLGLSPKFVEFVFLDPKPKRFRNWCEPRDSGWPCFIPENVSALYPLWTCNADVSAVWVCAGRIEFVRLCHDDPEPVVVARSEQGFLADLFRALLETAEPLDNLRKLAEVAGFRHMDALAQWQQKNGRARDYQKRWQRFVESLS
jgi:hypothetical protein